MTSSIILIIIYRRFGLRYWNIFATVCNKSPYLQFILIPFGRIETTADVEKEIGFPWISPQTYVRGTDERFIQTMLIQHQKKSKGRPRLVSYRRFSSHKAILLLELLNLSKRQQSSRHQFNGFPWQIAFPTTAALKAFGVSVLTIRTNYEYLSRC